MTHKQQFTIIFLLNASKKNIHLFSFAHRCNNDIFILSLCRFFNKDS